MKLNPNFNNVDSNGITFDVFINGIIGALGSNNGIRIQIRTNLSVNEETTTEWGSSTSTQMLNQRGAVLQIDISNVYSLPMTSIQPFVNNGDNPSQSSFNQSNSVVVIVF